MKSITKTGVVAALVLASIPAAHAAPVTYKLDPEHTFPSLEFDHMGVSTWRGRFNETSGTVTIDREAKAGSVDVTVKAASIDFGLASMHEHAATSDWLDFAKHPTATYKGTIAFEGEQPMYVDGKLTFRGVEKPLRLVVLRFNCIKHPMDAKIEICGADAEARLHWADFGMKRYGDKNSDLVTLRISAEGQRPL